MYIRDGIDELTLQVTHFLDSVKMCKTIHTQMHIACGTTKNMCPHLCFVAPHMKGTSHLVIVAMTGQVCPPRLIANWLRSAPVRGQSELLVIVDELIFLISQVPEVSTLSEPRLELALVPLTLDSFSFCTGLLFI